MNFPLALDIRSDLPVPIHRQLYEQIRQAILTGKLKSDQKLPASRQLAQFLGLSRSTVIQSYDQLMSEGYLKAQQGSGTFVCAQLPETWLQASLTEDAAEKDSATPVELSHYGQRLQQMSASPTQQPLSLSFRYWRPVLSEFPLKCWQKLVQKHSASTLDWMTYSTDPQGYRPLREALALYLSQARAVRCEPEQILITQGTQQALNLIVRVLLNPGDAIAFEDPGYLSARRCFTSHGASVIPVSVDESGLTLEGPAGLLARTKDSPVRMVYVTPSHQFPTGALMSLSRRLALLEWAKEQGAVIIEDDYDSEYRYSGRPIPALQGLDSSERVLYVGTFSKVMFPGLQIGYLVLPAELVPIFNRAKWLCDRQCSLIHQAALSEFISAGHLSAHIRRMRTLYHQRRDQLVSALHELVDALPPSAGQLKILGDAAGLHLMAQLPLGKRFGAGECLVAAAEQAGVGLLSARPYYDERAIADLMGDESEQHRRQTEIDQSFVFGFGGLSSAQMTEAMIRLKPLIRLAVGK